MYEHQLTKKTKDITNSPENKQQSTSKVTVQKQAVQKDRISPGSLTPSTILQLQRTIGNKATAQLLQESGVTRSLHPVQREAVPGLAQMMPAGGVVQRQEGEEEELQMMPASGVVQRQEGEEEELQMMPASGVVQRRENNTGMPDDLKLGIEALSGFDLSDVRVHRNSDKPPQVGALAYTQGNDIHIAPGQEQHLPHEAWHAVQQRQGRVQATTQAAGLPVNDEPALEKEADTMGVKALQMKNGTDKTTTGDHQYGCNCDSCAGLQPFKKNNNSSAQLKVAQMKELKESEMQTFAAKLTGGDTQTTVAVAKDGDTFNIYSKSSLSSQSEVIGAYSNVALKWDKNPGSGYHAETMALMDGGAGSEIAASQPICKRCQAALADNNVTAINPGTQYTEHWQAPFTEEIDENKTFPGKAEDASRDGQSGSRWGITEGKLKQIKKEIWGVKHPTGW